jgi:hypothetical protein
MTGGLADFLRALRGLQEAAEARFAGNSYYQVSNEIAGLIELTGLDTKGVPPSVEASSGFEAMLGEVRKLTEASLSGNNYYMAANRLETLRTFLDVAVETGKKDATAVNTQKRTFDDLAAVSRARVEEMAVSLGVPVARNAAPAHPKAAESPSDAELERRSSEPCSMPELAPSEMKAASSGSTKESARAGAVGAGVLANATKTATDGKIEPGKHSAPKQQKRGLFKLWLNAMFGRKG